MKTPDVNLQPSPRRLWPYLLMVAMCGLIAWALRENVQPSSSADSTTVVRSAPAIAAPPAHATAAAAAHKECACSQCAKPDPTIAEQVNQVQRANSPVVENLLRRFRQSDRAFTPSSFESLKTRPIGKHVTLIAAGIEWHGILDSRIDGPEVLHFGITLDDQLGRFQFSLREDQRMQSAILFNGENLALVANGFPENGSWKFETSTYDNLVCTPAGTVYSPTAEATEAIGAIKAPGTVAPSNDRVSFGPPVALSSKPKSTFVLYIDFDGEIVTHPGWNNGRTIVAAPDDRVDDVDYVTNVWKRVSEDFAPFDLNVTTNRAVFDAAAVSRRVMCISTPTNTAAPGAGGVAYLNSFGQNNPCWNFNIGSEYASADTVSHEIGHTLGLNHDGTDKEAYYGGHGGTGPYSWAPIMGAPWANANYEEVTSWSKGEYPKANNKEDDLKMITTKNGFGYEQDDKGDTKATAANLITVDGNVADSGIIGRTNDVDWIAFITSGGTVTLNVNVTDVNSAEVTQRGTNLAVSAELYDSAGVLLKTSNSPEAMDATISANLASGTYYLKVDGVARGTLATGFPEYGSLGQYSITGSVPQGGLLSINPPSSTFRPRAGAGSFEVTSDYPWSWTCSESWVTSTESSSQSGKQLFNFSVATNTSDQTRTAQIILSIPGYAVAHTITQSPKDADDHSNFFEGATPVTQSSITDGNIGEEGDLDVLQIKVTQYGLLTIDSSGITNTFGELFDARGTLLASNDNELVPNFRITHSAVPGTYYVRVRHAIERGTGAYKVVVRLNSQESLTINAASRSVPASAGEHSFGVVCNTAWSWTTSAPDWLTSAEATNQAFGQVFNYSVVANTSLTSRTGTITLTAGALSVTHTVVQIGSNMDDHGNTPELATTLVPTVLPSSLPIPSVSGNLETVGDSDVFRVVLPSSGDLKLWSTTKTNPPTDTYGYLLDSAGTEVARNDDLGSDNFGITYKVNAGTYYVKVRHFSPNGTGAYGLSSTFAPAKFISINYTASTGGSLSGVARQSVLPGGNAKPVTAVPKAGFAFIRWSDGHPSAARDDQNLISHLTVTAEFAPILSVTIVGGALVRDNQFPKVDYGTRWIDENVPMSFEIRNNGSTPLTGLKVVKSGMNQADWTFTTLSLTALEPGQSTILTTAMQASAAGYKNALFTVSATGSATLTFRIPVMANILKNIAVEASGNTALANPETRPLRARPARPARPAIHAAPPASAPDTAVIVSPDGLIRHRFLLAHNRPLVPDFFISSDGITWLRAEQIGVRKTDQFANWDEYEVILSPMGINSPVIWVSETPPPPAQR